ncbi:hypothetical protein PV11_06281 [Exophiala sideris]|uniref:Homogentisate 1,2-dioxygenase N-terminal domain-containing protein n=1 Tax=Exophiala sideris TaxID=1016849 RepID=A0A0D1VRH2_9EURO|nr:hypothetical protein PV11_06281 [Exophiala sideris]
MGSISNDIDGSYARNKEAVSGATADGPFVTTSTQEDPYSYQTGFGNRFSTEAVPGVLPQGGRNLPQRNQYDLYTEQAG